MRYLLAHDLEKGGLLRHLSVACVASWHSIAARIASEPRDSCMSEQTRWHLVVDDYLACEDPGGLSVC
jgi:hypothetical protein